ncbi:pyruvate dehydrogenase (acetyl-transferring) E1 component subunit alpha [Sulfobacillus harzensis]|uniref:Pyruvate dehydrogenase E1 component subunit alpha n=1 Tax=Sulfobacillus harzensis TaxID=2729629 RepID=A0A7Y0Q156_9FIRM|nr:pyruvate dehydrogenase (acetyl-transferring) E1 component subunit alpha [Sulfobacillus harzensis]NMP21107.1 pyruvate dehydrogenase (acetyl-transferring) E1 component subunit alpha [Sulfobacillus harzensis]
MDPEKEFPIQRVIDEDGNLVGDRSGVTDEELLRFYRSLVTLRALDQRAWNLQRQGRIGTYPPYSGQEATQVGVVAALGPEDWICGSYRDWAALVYRGVPMSFPLLNSMGHPISGRMPEAVPALPVQVVIAAQTLHAVGLAWAEKLQGQNRLAVTFFGDGATSQGDFHEALNLASVVQAPVLFVSQNNRWAISVPVSRQMHSPTIAQRAIAYNIEGVRVDGNDIIAVYQTARQLAARIRAGGGPALVEAVTYRLGAHTTADDPTRYRATEEEERLSYGEPVARLARFLERQKLIDDDAKHQIEEEAKAEVEKAVQEAESYPKAPPETVFDHVYGELTPALSAQRQAFMRRLAEGGGARG